MLNVKASQCQQRKILFIWNQPMFKNDTMVRKIAKEKFNRKKLKFQFSKNVLSNK